MTFERYFYMAVGGISILFTLINVFILLRRKKNAKSVEEKDTLDEEILNLTGNVFNYLHTFCNNKNIAYDFKKIKKQTIKSLKKEKEREYEKIENDQSFTGQEGVSSDGEPNS